MPLIYKICPRALGAKPRAGPLHGSARRPRGRVHPFSTAAQVAETAARHFAGQDDLLLVAVDADRLGPSLRFEASRGGDLFPHLYGDLPLSAVVSVEEMPLGPDGRHSFPEGILPQ